jgi:Flp pilus assembly protein TadD
VVGHAVSEQTPTPITDERAHSIYQQAQLYLEMRMPIEAAQIAAPLEHRDQVPESVLELLARAYFNSAQLSRAERVLRRLVEEFPSNGWAYRTLARTLARRQADVEAARYHRIADGFGIA